MKFVDVCKLFEKHGCTLLDGTDVLGDIVNMRKRANWKCKCGKISNTILECYKISKHHCCKQCAYELRDIENVKKHGVENVGQLHAHDLAYVDNYFKQEGCTLLSTEYKCAHDKLKYICSCGITSIVRFCDFKNKGTRCRKCAIQRREQTNLNRYGHKVPLSRWKEYVFPSGRTEKVQGYEPKALSDLISIGVPEEDIVTNRNDIPIIKYFHNGKICRYFPDIFIPSMNKIIEVKSSYTYKFQLIKNVLKALETRRQGYIFEFWLYEDNGVRNIF